MSEDLKDRGDWPSASNFPRLEKCPGSHLLKLMVNPPDEESEYSASGDRIHKALQRSIDEIPKGSEQVAFGNAFLPPKFPELSTEEAATAAKIWKQIGSVIDQTKDGSDKMMLLTERRYWGKTKSGIEFSGQIDLGILFHHHITIIDYKTGWGSVPRAEVNAQLLVQAVLMHKAYSGCSQIYAAIVQPNLGKPSISHYQLQQLQDACRYAEKIADSAYDPSALRRPTIEGCRYCPVKLSCKECYTIMTDLVTGIVPKDMGEALTHAEIAKQVAGALQDRAKNILKNDPAAIPGWELEAGANTTKVADTAAAFVKVSDIITADEFKTCCSVQIGKLSKVFECKSGLKGKNAKEALLNRLDGIAVTTQNQPSLVKVKA
jgi:RecB family exonuclease